MVTWWLPRAGGHSFAEISGGIDLDYPAKWYASNYSDAVLRGFNRLNGHGSGRVGIVSLLVSHGILNHRAIHGEKTTESHRELT